MVPLPEKLLIAVIGDVHHHLWMAFDELTRLESSLSRKISQVFSVGDLGLFLDAEDWEYLTGPERYRRTEDTARINDVWQQWCWPLSMIGGNHEPFNRLRDWDPGYYDYRLDYTQAGVMSHKIPGLRAYGLTGIQSPKDDTSGKRGRGAPSWSEMLESVSCGERDIRELTYYRQREVDQLLALPSAPDLLLTHNWPFAPSEANSAHAITNRPERQLLQLLRPRYHFAGHQHMHHIEQIGETRFEGLNIIQAKNNPHCLAEGWVRLLEWDGKTLHVVDHDAVPLASLTSPSLPLR